MISAYTVRVEAMGQSRGRCFEQWWGGMWSVVICSLALLGSGRQQHVQTHVVGFVGDKSWAVLDGDVSGRWGWRTTCGRRGGVGDALSTVGIEPGLPSPWLQSEAAYQNERFESTTRTGSKNGRFHCWSSR